ncbi:MAG: lysophospholipid acyltransferase family protein [Spirochaetota bacterium]
MIRGLAYWAGGILLTVVMFILVMILYPFSRRKDEYMHRMNRAWSRILLRGFLGVRLRVVGLEHLEDAGGGPFIIVSNHRSYTDILIGNAVMPLQFRWLAKESLFRLPLLGVAMRLAGYVPVARERSVSASRSLERVMEVLREGKSVWIFPEGTRTRQDRLGRFKRGAFLIALKSGFPLLPVVLVHSDLVFQTPLKAVSREVTVVIGTPLRLERPAPGTAADGERAAMERFMSRVRETIQSQYDAYADQPQ